MSKKEQVYFKICDSVLLHEVTKGHLKWSLSEISKHSGVTRSLIYYYMGKEKEEILRESILFMMEVFFNTNLEKGMGIVKRMELILTQIRLMPHVFIYYASERLKDSHYGNMLREREEALFVYMQKDLNLPHEQVMRIFFMEIGACAFQLDPSKASEFFKIK